MIHIFSGYLSNLFRKYSFSVFEYAATQDLHQNCVREFMWGTVWLLSHGKFEIFIGEILGYGFLVGLG